jgi:hypothetical protein
MRVLFFMRSTVYVRNFESTLRLLADRGHDVHVVAEVHQVLDPKDLMGRLCREHPRITHGLPPVPLAPRWSQLGVELRKAADYLRYLEPEYRHAPKLRLRAELTTPVFLAPGICRRLAGTERGRALLRRVLRVGDKGVPPDPSVQAFIRRHRPDLVLVTPLVEPGSPQSEYLRAARSLGVPTGLCVYSWDNLTSKGLIHHPVDVVTVWNQAMKDEAVALHHVPAEKVVITGAAAYDHWFSWTSRTSREAFCARVGLDPRRPYLLYLCSSKFIAPNEGPFVTRWIQEVRSRSAVLRDMGVLIRPHPQNMDRWHDADYSRLGHVAIWPRSNGNPADEVSRTDYYDSIACSAALVGINTSALIEGAIVGRGVFTLLAPEFRETQDGTLHFRHLRDVNGGLLHVASGMAEHVAQLEAALQNPAAAVERCRRFVEAFVRPYGVDQPAAPRLVAALEATAAARGDRRSERGPWWALLARPALGRVAAAVGQALRAQAETEAQRTREKRLDQEKRAARERAEADEAALVAASATQASAHFLRVRDRVRPLLAAMPADNGVTPAEQRVLAALQPLWDAPPDTIAALRRHAAALSGIRPDDYADTAERTVKYKYERDVRRLLFRGDAGLWVDEPPVLGAFGFTSNGRRYNEDTLRAFRVMSLLHDAALVGEFRDGSPRRTVWEIGGGWGGFAHHFKTVCPDVTYLITGRPELFLLSAVYLMTLFPAARFRFYDPADADAFWRDWGSVDFAFAPECVVSTMQPPSLALTVDLITLEHMNAARIGLHVRRAHDLGSRYFASVCPMGTSNGAVGTPVEPELDRFYWRHPVSAPESLARRLSLSPGEGGVDRTYFLGWKRLHV